MFRGQPRMVKKEEFKEKVLDLRRVARVVAGGKRFKFRATVVLGDEKGRVGIGIAKGVDVAQAVAKGKSAAKKNMLNVELKDGRTIAHEVIAKYSAAKVLLKPAKPGHGLRAGGAVRFVLALAGVKDATAKCLGRTPNKLTNALATLEALKKLKV
ncbi:30S ribosomal protein S5 [Candidatus Parcubacteria bacterium]|nr:MAG: 30S ribosomal protein S5 [Candidatus Parcubacteria bacterium]